MSRWVKTNQPCPCGKSSDAYAEDIEGRGFCFSCSKPFGETTIMNDTYTMEFVTWRTISVDTLRFFDVKTKVSPDGEPIEIGFPYGDGFIIRGFQDKQHRTIGSTKTTLFGQDKYSPASGRSVTITEGAPDSLAFREIFGPKYPVVAVRSSSSAFADASRNREYLNSFDRIYLCLDSDAPGVKATHEVARLFDFNKVYHVKMDLKDCMEYREARRDDDFRQIWHNAKRFMPEGIVSSFSQFSEIRNKAKARCLAEFPFPTLQEMTYGIREGDSYLFKALPGVGKSEVLRSILYHLLQTTDDNIAGLFLEDPVSEVLARIAGYHLKTAAHLPDSGLTESQIQAAYCEAIKRDDRLHFYHHFGSNDPDIFLDQVRFLATSAQCKFMFFDHFQRAVTGLRDDDERKTLDYLASGMQSLLKDLGFALLSVSHINVAGGTRGSGLIQGSADCIVYLSRDTRNPDPGLSGLINVEVEKNKFAGKSGPAGILKFTLETSEMREINPSRKQELPL